MSSKLHKGESIAVYLSSTAITAIQVRGGERGQTVVARAQVETPEGGFSTDKTVDSARLGQALRSLWRKARFRERSATIVLPSSGYSMRVIRLPEIPERERQPIVRGELEQAGALPSGSGFLDFFWLHRESQAEVSVYYSGEVLVRGLLEAFRGAGLRVDAIEPESVATIRAFLATSPQGQPAAILCPTEKNTDLCIYNGQEIRQVRRISVGWSDLAKSDTIPTGPGGTSASAATFLGMDVDEIAAQADREAMPYPLPNVSVWAQDQEQVVMGANPAAHPASVAVAPRRVEPVIEAPAPVALASEAQFLVAEITRSLAFHAREYPNEPRPELLSIVGSQQAIRCMESALAEAPIPRALGVDVLGRLDLPAPATPLGAVVDPNGPLLALYGAACGTVGAVRGFPLIDVTARQTISRTQGRSTKKLVAAGLSGAAIWFLISTGAAVLVTLLQMDAYNKLADIETEMKQVKAQREPALRYFEMTQKVRAAQRQVEIPAASVLGRVAAARNPGVSLTSLQIGADRRVRIAGVAADSASVQQLALRLGTGPTVRLPVIETLKRGDKGEITFTISAALPTVPPIQVDQD